MDFEVERAMSISGKAIQLDNGLRLHTLDGGSGTPLLFAHGFPLDHSMWRHQLEALALDHRVIAADLRGFGKSDSLPGPASMPAIADDLAMLLDALQIPQVVFCGLSMGGYVAWQFWERHPERLRGLIICDSRAAADSPETARGRLIMAERVRLEGAAPLIEAMLPRLFSAQTFQQQPAVVAAIRQTMAGTKTGAIAAALEGMAARADMSWRLNTMDVPALLLAGEDDVISPASEMRTMASAMPDARFVAIPNAGHLAPLEKPVEVNRAILEFLQERVT